MSDLIIQVANKFLERLDLLTEQLKRIADALEDAG